MNKKEELVSVTLCGGDKHEMACHVEADNFEDLIDGLANGIRMLIDWQKSEREAKQSEGMI